MGVLRPEGQAADEPVALETAVIATGARPGNVAAKRELFTEETQTVLVFERGAVIRLSAAVADGQLLFLTNKKTGKEVVTQVIRKRSFRPTSCYVDLEFTEPSPGFWGIEFPKSAPVLPSQMPSESSDDESSNAIKHAAPPDQQEVERLKKEVAELQTQLKTLTGTAKSAETTTPESGAGAGATSTSTSDVATPQHEERVLAQLLAQEAQQEQVHGPKRLVAYPKKGTSSVVKAASKVATAGAFAAVLVATAIAAYRFGLLDSFLAKSSAAKTTLNHSATSVNSATTAGPKSSNSASAPVGSAPPNPAPAASPTIDTLGSAASSVASNTASGTASIATSNEAPKRPETIPASSVANATPKDLKLRNSGAANGLADTSASSASGVPPSGPTVSAAGNGSATDIEDYVAAKLIHSVKPVSPPDALRNYVTGNVNVDAVVDVTGRVKSVTVLSGPEKLRSTAIEEIKQYVYEPARKNGKPVVSHVQASLKYWYEP
jgi:hypothetical protein